ncbi:unnamed protein product [Brassica rapa subsp. trilocularis]
MICYLLPISSENFRYQSSHYENHNLENNFGRERIILSW